MKANRIELFRHLQPNFPIIHINRIINADWNISIQIYPEGIPIVLDELEKESDFPILISNIDCIERIVSVAIHADRIDYRSAHFGKAAWQSPDDTLTILKKKFVAEEYAKFELWFREYLQEITLKYLGERLRIVDL